MYEFFKLVIANKSYRDLDAFLGKLRAAWGRGLLTDAQLDELTALSQANDPVSSCDLPGEISALWAAVRALEARLDGTDDPSPDKDEPIPAWKQPVGARDAYACGARVCFNGRVYESLLDGNVWAPDVYPAGWRELTE